MSFRVVLRPEAESDISEATTWYENQRPGLGEEFTEAVFQAVDALADNPLLRSRRHRRRNIRIASPRRLPAQREDRKSPRLIAEFKDRVPKVLRDEPIHRSPSKSQ